MGEPATTVSLPRTPGSATVSAWPLMTEYESARAVPTTLAADAVEAPSAIPAVAIATTRSAQRGRDARGRPPARGTAMSGGEDDLAVNGFRPSSCGNVQEMSERQARPAHGRKVPADGRDVRVRRSGAPESASERPSAPTVGLPLRGTSSPYRTAPLLD